MGLSLVVPLFGPPAAGKTTLTMMLAGKPGISVFRLREHVPRDLLSISAGNSQHPGWLDPFTVDEALSRYFVGVQADRAVTTVLLDNFPGSASQVDELVSVVRECEPTCRIEAVEVFTDNKTLEQRARTRKVCHRCECDPISDPRLPAIPAKGDPWKCSRCAGTLHPRRSDSPSLRRARMKRYQQAAEGIRTGFHGSGIPVSQLDTTTTIDGAANLLVPLVISRSAAR
ncbi:AAA family ATPase [Nocardia jejuensis]|uniref:AAA family ATPase n=1 Tax=Nocardia jejuensis TaxID=328049 RepID=UPI000831CBF0|nr:AAA family ATPase [Nocardia jejuensis]